jgi:hypothetical protein
MLVGEVLAQVSENEKNTYRSMTLEEYEAELDRAEAAGEIPS